MTYEELKAKMATMKYVKLTQQNGQSHYFNAKIAKMTAQTGESRWGKIEEVSFNEYLNYKHPFAYSN